MSMGHSEGFSGNQALFPTIGWREWVELPELGIRHLKAKVDSGARSSALSASNIAVVRRGDRERVRFRVYVRPRSDARFVECEADVIEYRDVRSSNGQVESRPMIRTEIKLLGQRFPIQLTLADRQQMGFRMLLGREAFRQRFLLDAGRSYLGGRPTKQHRRPLE
jgi:hypothetical protein